MPVSSQSTRIEVVPTFFTTCDLCSDAYASYKLPDTVTLVRVPKEEGGGYTYMGLESFRLLEPLTTQQVIADLLLKGWTVSTFHGKDLLLCPACSVK